MQSFRSFFLPTQSTVALAQCRQAALNRMDNRGKEIDMSNLKSEETLDESTKTATHEPEELNEKELEDVSGGKPRFLNPQPLPPFDGGF
jgi:hypothetical protein